MGGRLRAKSKRGLILKRTSLVSRMLGLRQRLQLRIVHDSADAASIVRTLRSIAHSPARKGGSACHRRKPEAPSQLSADSSQVRPLPHLEGPQLQQRRTDGHQVIAAAQGPLVAGYRPTGFIYAGAREAPDFEAAKPPARDMLHVNIRRLISPSPRGSPSHVLFGRVLRCCPGFELPSRWCDNRIRTSHSSTLHTVGPFNLKG